MTIDTAHFNFALRLSPTTSCAGESGRNATNVEVTADQSVANTYRFHSSSTLTSIDEYGREQTLRGYSRGVQAQSRDRTVALE